MHITTYGPGALVAIRCKFTSTNVSGGSGSVGMDSGSGLFVYLYQCDLSHGTTGGMNLHGAEGNTEPVIVVWEQCTNNGSFGYAELGDATTGLDPDLNTSGDVTEHTTGTPPRPEGALGEAGQAYYYPSQIATPHTQTFGSGDQAPFSPPAGRTYYIPAALTSAIHRTNHGVVANSAGGVVAVRSGHRTTPPATGSPGTQSLGTLGSGVNEGVRSSVICGS